MTTSKSASVLDIIDSHKPRAPRQRWELGYKGIIPSTTQSILENKFNETIKGQCLNED